MALPRTTTAPGVTSVTRRAEVSPDVALIVLLMGISDQVDTELHWPAARRQPVDDGVDELPVDGCHGQGFDWLISAPSTSSAPNSMRGSLRRLAPVSERKAGFCHVRR
jgi:hypothetical protein